MVEHNQGFRTNLHLDSSPRSSSNSESDQNDLSLGDERPESLHSQPADAFISGLDSDRDEIILRELEVIQQLKYPALRLIEEQINRFSRDIEDMLREDAERHRLLGNIVMLLRRYLLLARNLYYLAALLIVAMFFLGLVLGAATCGSWLGRFNSPILTGINDYFAPGCYINPEDAYRSIV